MLGQALGDGGAAKVPPIVSAVQGAITSAKAANAAVWPSAGSASPDGGKKTNFDTGSAGESEADAKKNKFLTGKYDFKVMRRLTTVMKGAASVFLMPLPRSLAARAARSRITGSLSAALSAALAALSPSPRLWLQIENKFLDVLCGLYGVEDEDDLPQEVQDISLGEMFEQRSSAADMRAKMVTLDIPRIERRRARQDGKVYRSHFRAQGQGAAAVDGGQRGLLLSPPIRRPSIVAAACHAFLHFSSSSHPSTRKNS